MRIFSKPCVNNFKLMRENFIKVIIIIWDQPFYKISLLSNSESEKSSFKFSNATKQHLEKVHSITFGNSIPIGKQSWITFWLHSAELETMNSCYRITSFKSKYIYHIYIRQVVQNWLQTSCVMKTDVRDSESLSLLVVQPHSKMSEATADQLGPCVWASAL